MRKGFLPVLIIAGVLVAGGGVYALTHHFAARYLTTQHSAAEPSQPVTCEQQATQHRIIIQHNTVQPHHTQATLCDTLTITNEDSKLRILAFGRHEHHQAYDGVTEKRLGDSQSLTVTLNQTGTFTFHDHLQEETQGDFTVVSQQ
jgi:plastocyanin